MATETLGKQYSSVNSSPSFHQDVLKCLTVEHQRRQQCQVAAHVALTVGEEGLNQIKKQWNFPRQVALKPLLPEERTARLQQFLAGSNENSANIYVTFIPNRCLSRIFL